MGKRTGKEIVKTEIESKRSVRKNKFLFVEISFLPWKQPNPYGSIKFVCESVWAICMLKIL